MSALRDETGKHSMARIVLAVVLAWLLVVLTLDALGRASLAERAYGLLEVLLTALVAWAAGPRVVAYAGDGARKLLERFRGGV